ncbi:MAG TPA: hypothetical protein PKA16_14290 [Ottowia sp.]|uniref:hypothetical protein n=1 Tax=Ottowia sp. TaxID=1898956 RepID=UPI002C3D5D6A|nr:hypothetical protein [Ottowia sp.]HMN22549.1 hypothetical protein [Ottowia sp.]
MGRIGKWVAPPTLAAVLWFGLGACSDGTISPEEGPAQQEDVVCNGQVVPKPGQLGQAAAGDPLTYRSLDGQVFVRVDKHQITTTVRCTNTVQVWGDPHENLNGKHIKDWLDPGLRRTFLLPGDLKITMSADGPHRVVHTTSIYEGGQCFEIDNNTNTLRHRCADAAEAAQREADETDGETAEITVDIETDVMSFTNVYDEQPGADGEPPVKVNEEVPLGTTGGFAEPKKVIDLFDDPRLAST